MVVPLCSHMTNLCLLQGVQATCQSRLSLSLSPPLRLCLSPSFSSLSYLQTHASLRVLRQPACFCCTFVQNPYAVTVLFLKWRLLSLTMSLLCCFFFRDYGSKRKSGKSPMVHLCHTCSLFHLVADQN